jgi:hypothetical protein
VPATAASVVRLSVPSVGEGADGGATGWPTQVTELVASLATALGTTTSDDRSSTVVLFDVGVPRTGEAASHPLVGCAIEAARSLVQARALEQPTPPTNLLLVDGGTDPGDVDATIAYLGSPGGAFVHGSSIDLRSRW